MFAQGSFILGPEVERFEAEFGEYLQVKHVIGVNSGTDALFLALKAHGIGTHDEVITVANTAVPTVSAIRMTGATPVFVDVFEDSQTIDVSLIERAINCRTRAILPVHLFGYPACMKEILKTAKKHRLIVVEDACQAHGAIYEQKRAGSIGDAGCFSFYPTKNLGAFGDAGAVVTNNKRIADKIRALRNYGEVKKFETRRDGVNTRMDEVQAALLRWGLKHLDEWNRKRAEIANRYLQRLSNSPLKLPLSSGSITKRVWHLFVVNTDRRNALQRYLFDRGIQTMIHYPTPIHKQRPYRLLPSTPPDLPVTTRLAKRIVSLPLHPDLTWGQISDICTSICDFYGTRS